MKQYIFGARNGMWILGGNTVFENNLLNYCGYYGDASEEAVMIAIGAKEKPATCLPSESANNSVRFNTILNSGGTPLTADGRDSEIAYNRIKDGVMARHATHGDGSLIHHYARTQFHLRSLLPGCNHGRRERMLY